MLNDDYNKSIIEETKKYLKDNGATSTSKLGVILGVNYYKMVEILRNLKEEKIVELKEINGGKFWNLG